MIHHPNFRPEEKDKIIQKKLTFKNDKEVFQENQVEPYDRWTDYVNYNENIGKYS